MSTDRAQPRRFDGILVEMWGLPVTTLTCVAALALTFVGWSSIGYDPFVIDGRAFRTEPWRLLSAHFVHGDPLHIIFNLYWTWTFGQILEPRLGWVRFLALVVFLALGVSLSCHAFDVGGIGLSGIGYGLWAFLALGGRRAPELRGLVDRRTNNLFIVWFFVCIALTLGHVWRISNWGHASGAVLGAFVALMIEPGLSLKPTRWAALNCLLLALLGCATLFRDRVNFGAGAEIDAYDAHEALTRGDWATAQARATSAMRIDPTSKYGWSYLSIAQWHLGDERGSLDSAFRSFELGQRDPEAIAWLAGALSASVVEEINEGRPDAALVSAQRGVQVASVTTGPTQRDAWWDLSRARANLDQRREAADAALHAFDLGRRDDDSREWLARSLARVTADEFDAERFESALGYARRAVEVAPLSPPHWANVKIMAERAGNSEWVERAKAELERLPPLPK